MTYCLQILPSAFCLRSSVFYLQSSIFGLQSSTFGLLLRKQSLLHSALGGKLLKENALLENLLVYRTCLVFLLSHQTSVAARSYNSFNVFVCYLSCLSWFEENKQAATRSQSVAYPKLKSILLMIASWFSRTCITFVANDQTCDS